MESSVIRSMVDDIKFKLRDNATTFTLDDSVELVHKLIDLQCACSHTRNDGVFYFSLQGTLACPICDLSKEKANIK